MKNEKNTETWKYSKVKVTTDKKKRVFKFIWRYNSATLKKK